MVQFCQQKEFYIQETVAFIQQIQQLTAIFNTVLNLNCVKAPSRIVTNRKNVYAVCIQQLMRLQPQGNWKRSTLDKVLRDWTEKKNGKYIEYAGVAIYLLKKYLAKCKM